MLRSLYLNNFRAFRRVDISLSKLNIFVGPNNSGKSSIISAINLIAQNVRRGRQSYSLALNGNYADLGTFNDVIHGHKATSKLTIAFQLDNFHYEYQYRYRPKRREIELVRHEVIDDTAGRSYDYATTRDGTRQRLRIGSRFIDLNALRLRPRFFGLTSIVPYSALMASSDPNLREVADNLRRLMFRSSQELDLSFSAFDSVGAFRAAPQRTYMYTGEAPEEVGRNGENSAQMFAAMASSRDKKSARVISEVGQWFVDAGVSNGVEIKSLTNRHFELCIKDRTGVPNNIVDAGFGCSQVLPVIVAGYRLEQYKRAVDGGIYVVQEPEIHLHPSAAAHLGTYFVDLARRNIQCFVETHSENLVLRVARHIAAKHIAPSDVKIYWVSDTGDGRTVTPLEFSPDGSFADDWPEGFFPTRSNETMDLARLSSGLKSKDQLELRFQE